MNRCHMFHQSDNYGELTHMNRNHLESGEDDAQTPYCILEVRYFLFQ